MLLRIAIWLVLMFGALHARAEIPRMTPELIAEIEDLVLGRMNDVGAKGLAIALVQDGEVVYEKGFGVADANGRPITPDTVFNVGSVTKPFIALAVLQLEAAGKLSLDAPVTDYFPDFQTRYAEKSSGITVRHLIRHRSGFTTRQGRVNMSQDEHAKVADPDVFFDSLKNVRLAFEPDEDVSYSNMNYYLLGLIIESVSGQTYAEYVQQKILDPLGMSHSAIGSLPAGAPGALPHLYWFGIPQELTDAPVSTGPAGGLNTTAADLALFLIAMASADPRVVPEGALETMAQSAPGTSDWGIATGWFLHQDTNGRVFQHSGYGVGYEATVAFSPETGMGVVALANSSTGFVSNPIGSLLNNIGQVTTGLPVRPPYQYGTERLALAAMVLVVLGALAWIILLVRNAATGRIRPAKGTGIITRLALPSVLAALGAWAMVFAVPELFQSDIGSAIAFQPDGGYMLVLAGVLLALAAVLHAALMLVAANSGTDT